MPRGSNPNSWGHGKRGSQHHRWNPKRLISSHGYVKIRVGRDHPLADPNGYAYEHLVVWVSAGNARPKRGELLHHRNEDKTDNRMINLELKPRGSHNAEHLTERLRDARGRLLTKNTGIEHNDSPETRS